MQIELSEKALRILLVVIQANEVRSRAARLKGSFSYLMSEGENANTALAELGCSLEDALLEWKPTEQERESIRGVFPGCKNYSKDGGTPLEFQFR